MVSCSLSDCSGNGGFRKPLNGKLHVGLDRVEHGCPAMGHVVQLYTLDLFSYKWNITIGVDQPIIPVGPVPIGFSKHPVFPFFTVPFNVINSTNYYIGVFNEFISIGKEPQISVILVKKGSSLGPVRLESRCPGF